MPASMPFSDEHTISSSMRLAWRVLRATSVVPFLLLSSSSRVMIGTYRSCSSKRNRLVGSCISTLVSSTKSLRVGSVVLRRVLLRAGLAVSEASAARLRRVLFGAAAALGSAAEALRFAGMLGRVRSVAVAVGERAGW